MNTHFKILKRRFAKSMFKKPFTGLIVLTLSMFLIFSLAAGFIGYKIYQVASTKSQTLLENYSYQPEQCEQKLNSYVTDPYKITRSPVMDQIENIKTSCFEANTI
jgi:hypothetical protein